VVAKEGLEGLRAETRLRADHSSGKDLSYSSIAHQQSI
jgi:hypothetical protein